MNIRTQANKKGNRRRTTQRWLSPLLAALVVVLGFLLAEGWGTQTKWRAVIAEGAAQPPLAAAANLPQSVTLPAPLPEGETTQVTFTNEYTGDPTDLEVTKIWDVMLGAGETLPGVSDLTIILVQKKEVVTAGAASVEATGEEFAITMVSGQALTDMTWLYSATVPQFDVDGKPFIYEALETTIPHGYDVSYDQGALTVTNTYDDDPDPEDPDEHKENDAVIKVYKIWDIDPADGAPPFGALNVTILRNGEPVPDSEIEALPPVVADLPASVTASGEQLVVDGPSCVWEYTFYVLAYDRDGEPYEYTVSEAFNGIGGYYAIRSNGEVTMSYIVPATDHAADGWALLLNDFDDDPAPPGPPNPDIPPEPPTPPGPDDPPPTDPEGSTENNFLVKVTKTWTNLRGVGDLPRADSFESVLSDSGKIIEPVYQDEPRSVSSSGTAVWTYYFWVLGYDQTGAKLPDGTYIVLERHNGTLRVPSGFTSTDMPDGTIVVMASDQYGISTGVIRNRFTRPAEPPVTGKPSPPPTTPPYWTYPPMPPIATPQPTRRPDEIDVHADIQVIGEPPFMPLYIIPPVGYCYE